MGLSTLYPLPTQTFLQVSVCLNPKWLPLVDVSAQVPSHPPAGETWEKDVGLRPRALGHGWFSRSLQPSAQRVS